MAEITFAGVSFDMGTACRIEGQVYRVLPTPKGEIAYCSMNNAGDIIHAQIPVEKFGVRVEEGDEFLLNLATAGAGEPVYRIEVLGPTLPEDLQAELDAEMEAIYASVRASRSQAKLAEKPLE